MKVTDFHAPYARIYEPPVAVVLRVGEDVIHIVWLWDGHVMFLVEAATPPDTDWAFAIFQREYVGPFEDAPYNDPAPATTLEFLSRLAAASLCTELHAVVAELQILYRAAVTEGGSVTLHYDPPCLPDLLHSLQRRS